MAYTSVISLNTAKNWLKIDDTLTADDALITGLINSACSYIEKRTNHLFFARSKNYRFYDYCVDVYDYPINSLITPSDAESTDFELYTLYETKKSTDKILTLNVGYQNTTDVPPELIDCALYLIDWLYYGKEEKKTLNALSIPRPIMLMIDANKRYII